MDTKDILGTSFTNPSLGQTARAAIPKSIEISSGSTRLLNSTAWSGVRFEAEDVHHQRADDLANPADLGHILSPCHCYYVITADQP